METLGLLLQPSLGGLDLHLPKTSSPLSLSSATQRSEPLNAAVSQAACQRMHSTAC